MLSYPGPADEDPSPTDSLARILAVAQSPAAQALVEAAPILSRKQVSDISAACRSAALPAPPVADAA